MENWEEKFNEKFVRELDGDEVLMVQGYGVTLRHPQPDEIKSFIRELVAAERKAAIKELNMVPICACGNRGYSKRNEHFDGCPAKK
jgi:hypothetical protein